MIRKAGFDAVVLAGGAARRLGGVDKPGQSVGGRPLLDRVLAAVLDAATVVVVGPERPTVRSVHWTREVPAGSGPAAALAAGLSGLACLAGIAGAAAVRADLAVVLAADLPFLTAEVVHRLLVAAGEPGGPVGAVLADAGGAPQWLAGAWQMTALRPALAGVSCGSLRAVLAPLVPVVVACGATVGAPPWYDCDTLEDLRRAEAWT